jgi:hypothetical protein
VSRKKKTVTRAKKRAATKVTRAKPKVKPAAKAAVLKTWHPDEPMESAEYLAALTELGLTVASQRTAKALGVSNVRQSQRYASGDAVIPASVARLLAMYIKHGLPNDVRDDA